MFLGLLARLDGESRARLLAEAFERSAIAKAVATTAGELVEVNNAFCGLTGYRRDELVGRPIAMLLPRDEPFDGFGDLECERRIVRRDGTRGWILTRVLPVRGSGYVVLESVESDEHHDLTDRVARSVDEARGLRTTIAIQREIAAAAGDRELLVTLAAERALQVLPTGDGAAVHLLDATGEAIPIVAAAGYAPPWDARREVTLTGTMVGLAVATRSTLRCDDTATDPRALAEAGRADDVRSVVIAPLLRPDGPIGVLTVIAREAHAFGEADEQQLTLLADAVAGALRHAEHTERNRELLFEATEANAALARQRAAALAAVQRLEQSEGRFAEVFDHSPLAKVVLGLRGADYGRILLANPAFSELIGSEPAAIPGVPLGDLVAMPRPDYDAALASLAAGERHRSTREVVLRRRDGAQVNVAAHTSVISDQAGPAAAVVQLLDVTRERAAALALARSEEQFRTAFSGSPLGLVLCDEDDVFRQANPAAADLIGRSAGELAGLRYTDVTDPGDLATAADARTGLRTGGQVRYDQRILRPDGRIVWARVTLSLVPGPAGEPWRLMQLEDIAAERAAAMAAEREHRRLQHTLSVQRELIAVAADRDAALHVVAERAVELFPAADGAAVELAEDAYLVYAATAGTLAGALGTRVRIDASLSGAAMTADATAHCRNAARDPRVDREACARLGIAAMLVVPLHADDSVIGVLKVSSRHPDVFDEADEQQLALLAEALASALRHADDAAALAARNAELEEADRLKRDLIGMLGHELGNPLAGDPRLHRDRLRHLVDPERGHAHEGRRRHHPPGPPPRRHRAGGPHDGPQRGRQPARPPRPDPAAGPDRAGPGRYGRRRHPRRGPRRHRARGRRAAAADPHEPAEQRGEVRRRTHRGPHHPRRRAGAHRRRGPRPGRAAGVPRPAVRTPGPGRPRRGEGARDGPRPVHRAEPGPRQRRRRALHAEPGRRLGVRGRPGSGLIAPLDSWHR
ncbi:hypothetical protein GCM10020218_107110 [Dactylosporangium vinaceum]